MINRAFIFGFLTAVTATACSAAPVESQGTSEEALAACPLGEACAPPVVDVLGTWSRQAGMIGETLELRADHTYSLVETSTPVCIRFPCTAPVTVIARTDGLFTQSTTLITLEPVTPDARLPESFDIVRRLVPAEGEAASDPTFVPAPPFASISLHAVEGGHDIVLTRAAAQDCPTGTFKCNRCGVYPPGGVCTTFVCLPPTQRCIPVP